MAKSKSTRSRARQNDAANKPAVVPSHTPEAPSLDERFNRLFLRLMLHACQIKLLSGALGASDLEGSPEDYVAAQLAKDLDALGDDFDKWDLDRHAATGTAKAAAEVANG